MKIGDLVKYVPSNRLDDFWRGQMGIVVRCIAGTDERKVVQWMDGARQSIPERNLEVVSE